MTDNPTQAAPEPKPTRRGRPSATLVLGVLTGLLASVTVLPTIIPLTYRVVSTEESSVLNQVTGAGIAAEALFSSGVSLPDGLAERMVVDGIVRIDAEGEVVRKDGNAPAAGVLLRVCGDAESPEQRYVGINGVRWAVACLPSDDHGKVVAVKRPDTESVAFVGYLVLGLAAMVGLSTALGVLQLLSPLSEVSHAFARVSAGERGARAASTGLAELDELVDHLNAAAEALEDREALIQGRVRVVQEMARLVAHEVRNPLQSLELLASLIASEDEREERETLAASIHEEVRGLENVVGRMLHDSTHGGALRIQPTPSSVRDMVEKVITFRRPEARKKGIKLEAGGVTDTVLSIDRTLAIRALENLVSNALSMVPPQNGRVVVSTSETDTHVCFLVDDNGPGVHPDLADAIYQPQVTGRPGGTGLGLALVAGVTQEHGGYVEHTTSQLGGARFMAWFAKTAGEDQGGQGEDPGGG